MMGHASHTSDVFLTFITDRQGSLTLDWSCKRASTCHTGVSLAPVLSWAAL